MKSTELRRLDRAFPDRCRERYEPTLREFLDVTDDFDVARIGAHMFRRTKELGKFRSDDLKRLHALEVNGKDFGTEVMLLVQARALGSADRRAAATRITGCSSACVTRSCTSTTFPFAAVVKTIREGLTGFCNSPLHSASRQDG